MDLVPEKRLNPRIGRVIGVISGKGGVGKSTVAVLLAQSLAASGHSVGVLDADITGPSVPRLLGVDSFRAESDGKMLFPIVNEEGIKVLSINLFNENEDEPVIWRGPLLGKAIEQFWGDADWGDLDYLIIDFPPGTSDIALTAFQTIPFSGVVVVATPQDYVSMIVTKSVKMAAMLKTPVLGVVENMRFLICPSCGEKIKLFDDGSAASGAGAAGGTDAESTSNSPGTPTAAGGAGASRLGLPLLASLPWRREVAQARSIRWSDLPEPVREDADRIARAVETGTSSTRSTAQKAALSPTPRTASESTAASAAASASPTAATNTTAAEG